MTKLLLLWNVHFKAMFGVTVLTSKCFRLMHCYRYGKRSAHLSFPSLKAGFARQAQSAGSVPVLTNSITVFTLMLPLAAVNLIGVRRDFAVL